MGPVAGDVARPAQRCVAAKRPGSATPGGVVSAQRVVRASSALAKHGTAAFGGLPKSRIRLGSSSYSGGWRWHPELMAFYSSRALSHALSPPPFVHPDYPH